MSKYKQQHHQEKIGFWVYFKKKMPLPQLFASSGVLDFGHVLFGWIGPGEVPKFSGVQAWAHIPGQAHIRADTQVLAKGDSNETPGGGAG